MMEWIVHKKNVKGKLLGIACKQVCAMVAYILYNTMGVDTESRASATSVSYVSMLLVFK